MMLFLTLYRWLMARSTLYAFNLHLYKLSLRGLGVLNAEGSWATGERWFLHRLAIMFGQQPITIFDIGANTGTYTIEALEHLPNASVVACEPHPQTWKKLKKNTKQLNNVILENVALSSKTGVLKLWDFAQSAPLKHTQPTSTLSSLNRSVIEELHRQPAEGFQVKVMTIDQLARKHGVKHISLLKIDTEGYELHVLQGAKKLINKQGIDVIQFEFNEMQVYTRTFVRDLIKQLPGYSLYRLLPNGAVLLEPYRPLEHEIFGFQNIVATRPGMKLY